MVDSIMIALLLLAWRGRFPVALAIEPLQISDGLQARQPPLPIELILPGSTRRAWKGHIGVHKFGKL
jgi:hypothetical protein